MLGALVGLGLGCAVLRVNPPRRRRRRARSNPPGVNEHIYYASGGAKTVCTSHVLAAFGIDACEYHYSGKKAQRAAILRRHGYAVRSRMSKLGKRRTVGAARKAIRAMRDPPGTKYMVWVLAGDTYSHLILLGQAGETLVDTDPREADRRRVHTIHAVFKVSSERSNPCGQRNPVPRKPPTGWRIIRHAYTTNGSRFDRRMGFRHSPAHYYALADDGRRLGPFLTARGARAAAHKAVGERSNPRSNPPVAKRSKDFAEFGTYDVVLGDGTTVQIARDGGSGGGGWWYVEWPNLHYSQRLLGFTKAEALAAVEDKVARLRAGNYR